MSYKSKTLAAAGNPATVKAGPQELGWDPSEIYREHQITAYGLDGGTYTVKGVVPSDDGKDVTLRVLATGKAVGDIVTLSGLLLTYFEVTFAGLGGQAAPKVNFTSLPRGL